MAPKRIDAADTCDNATHLIHRLQSDGWGVKGAAVEFEYATLSPNGKTKLPIKATVTVELIPVRG